MKVSIRKNRYKKHGKWRKGAYKLRMRVFLGKKKTPKTVEFGLGTNNLEEAKSRAEVFIKYAHAIGAYLEEKPYIHLVEVSANKRPSADDMALFKFFGVE